MRDRFPTSEGLYRSEDEKDACGIGLVANIGGAAEHRILRLAISAVNHLGHRGGIMPDGVTSDGVGIMTQLPIALLRREARKMGLEWGEDECLGVGMCFFPKDPVHSVRCREIFEEVVRELGLSLLGWREVPTVPSGLAASVQASVPQVLQALILRGASLASEPYERVLYRVRLLVEKRITEYAFSESGEEDPGWTFSIPSLSCQTVVYKGLLLGPQLDIFYPDLCDPEYRTSVALFHQRYSTNTFPTWSRAQPMRLLAHNGEINTIGGNTLWMQARARSFKAGDLDLPESCSFIDVEGSDSARLDNTLELLVSGKGGGLLRSMNLLIPEAYEGQDDISPALRAYYEHQSTLMEPWDGPSALVFCDGRIAAAALDRNGLRPLRYEIAADGTFIVASEVGTAPLSSAEIIERGRLGPGQMIAVDLEKGVLLRDGEIKAAFADEHPYQDWIQQRFLRSPKSFPKSFPKIFPKGLSERLTEPLHRISGEEIAAHVKLQKTFGYGTEEPQLILKPMLLNGKSPVGSMGDDTPLAVFSARPQLLYRYFKQRFAQVTNPPIDPLRERAVMSLRSLVGRRGDLFSESSGEGHLLVFESPILSTEEFEWLRERPSDLIQQEIFDATFEASGGVVALQAAITELCAQAERSVRGGSALLILCDRGVSALRAPVPMLLLTAALHHHLIAVGLRTKASVVCDTGEPREDHHFACLIGYGAALVHPYLAYQSVSQILQQREGKPKRKGTPEDPSRAEGLANYRRALEGGLLKILSKMGISTISSYCGARVFESIGLSSEVLCAYFGDTPSPIGGSTLQTVTHDALYFHAEAWLPNARLQEKGTYRYRRGGELHAFNPPAFKALHKAVRERDFEAFKAYARLTDERPSVCNIRDLLTWKTAATPLSLDEVEPAEEIVRRFSTQAMSHGSISREAHEVLAVAMNRLGAKTNSGEGGEARERFYRYKKEQRQDGDVGWRPTVGDLGNSAIKQVASGRFGVTPEYLISAKQIEIKMAQGSKPGEGGQIPGHKVTEEIAGIRNAVPGITLISPPPHHDIYSIEDLAQLIYDLKRINRRAEIGVKLVSTSGVGTIAAGVVKGGGDYIQISGSDGGTGASSLSSIKHVGIPWELGLAEIQQVLVKNDLRGRILLRVDGGMRTGRDVVLAALLGADAFGFGTTALIASGCVMARRCHLNSCPVGIATQDPKLRKRFPGTPEHIITAMLFIAEQVRHILAAMGARSLDEIVGQVGLLEHRTVTLPRSEVDLSKLLFDPNSPKNHALKHQAAGQTFELRPCLDDRIWRDCEMSIFSLKPVSRRYTIQNGERSVGARLSGEIERYHRGGPIPPETFSLHFEGVAGQSFGVFCNRGMRLSLVGEAQDYVGKGMAGGEIIVRLPENSSSRRVPVLVGNTVMYGATGGALYVGGQAGERLAVRNSGGHVVVEGCGEHGCEYMTNGVVVILGSIGRNFGAGMSGGVAFVHDPSGVLCDKFNPGMIHWNRLGDGLDAETLRGMLEQHAELTKSKKAQSILADWSKVLTEFWLVVPKTA